MSSLCATPNRNVLSQIESLPARRVTPMYDFRTTILVPSVDKVPYLIAIFRALTNVGMGCRICTDPEELERGRRTIQGDVFLLDATGEARAGAQRLAARLRAARPCFVALLVDASATGGGDTGADICLDAGMEPAGLAAALFSEVSRWQGYAAVRTRTDAGEAPASPAVQEGPTPFARDPYPPGTDWTRSRPERQWTLKEDAWYLVAPTGQTLRLSGAERRLMLRLLHARDCFLSHEAVEADSSEGSLRSRRLVGKVVSGLRLKCHLKRLVLPIHSLRGAGYQFAAMLVAEDAPQDPQRQPGDDAIA